MNVYLLRVGTLNESKNVFEFYRDEVYSSKAKLERAVENMINCNNGYNISREDDKYGITKETLVTYSCMSAPDSDGTSVPMRVRYVLKKMKVE